MELAFTIENIVLLVEFVVILLLLWHTNELRKSSKELSAVLKEMDATHKEIHKDTKSILAATDRLEGDIAKMK